MHEIQKLRLEIDQIHGELAQLFKRRLAVTRRIWEIKKVNDLPFFDAQRENEIVHRFDSLADDEYEKNAVQSFFKALLNESKKYLETSIK